jgi:hypothetical protein
MRHALQLLLLVVAVLVVAGIIAYQHLVTSQPAPVSQPAPAPPKPLPVPEPDAPRCPNCPHRPRPRNTDKYVLRIQLLPIYLLEDDDNHPTSALAEADDRPVLGGIVSPDGQTHSVLWTETIDWPHNIASAGLGCCSFRALDYCARLQDEEALVGLPEKMVHDHIPGGGYPEKVDRVIAKYAPSAHYWNDTSGDTRILTAAWRSQRPVCIDYSGHDPHYQGSIAHCVTLIAYDPDHDWTAILDNNYPKIDQIVWMSRKALKQRWHGWNYGLLKPQRGYVAGNTTYEAYEGEEHWAGGRNFGLVRPTRMDTGKLVIDGKPATVDDLLAAIGGEMVPKIEPHIDSRVTIDPQATLVGAACAIAGVFVIWVIMDTQSRRRR